MRPNRTQRANSGTAFGTASTDVFGYNAKGDVARQRGDGVPLGSPQGEVFRAPFGRNTNQVTGATNATIPARDQSFAYDDIGNRKTFTTTVGTTSYTANTLNQYTQVSGFSSQPSYDADGNQLATGLGQAYVWDAENRLVAVEPVIPTGGDKKVLNTYDSQSRRVRRQVFTYTSGAWGLTSDEKFIYDGWNVVAVLGWNPSTSTFVLNKTLTWGLDLSGSFQGAGGVGGLLAIKDGTGGYHYTYDANGNVSEVLNSAGTTAAHYEYTPFGDTLVASGTYASSNEFRFSTKSLDGASGLYYYGFRYYNPSTGRWPSRDPIGEEGGLNMYAFVYNDSISCFDYLGLDARRVDGDSSDRRGGDRNDEGRRNRERRRGGDLQSDWAGRAILRRWLTGGGDWILLNDPDWSRYMMANEELRSSVSFWVVQEGLSLSRRHNGGNFTERVNLTRHAEMENGEGIVGYQYLHGTNGSVGDFTIRGTIKGNACALEVDLAYAWNDIIDPNPNFSTDQWKSIVGEVISFGQAEDYNIRIIWNAKGKKYFRGPGVDGRYDQGWPFVK